MSDIKNPEPALMRTLQISPLRLVPYTKAMARQLELVDRCVDSGGAENFLLMFQHPPVITLGRTADRADIRCAPEELEKKGIKVIKTNRGGKITFHGPGQLVMYPVIDLRRRGRDLHRYLRDIEKWIIDLLAVYDVAAYVNPPHTGVWADGGKIASIGIAVRRWVAYHGVALNVSTDMRFFDYIVPCGLPGVSMTRIESLTSRPIPLPKIAAEAADKFKKVFDF